MITKSTTDLHGVRGCCRRVAEGIVHATHREGRGRTAAAWLAASPLVIACGGEPGEPAHGYSGQGNDASVVARDADGAGEAATPARESGGPGDFGDARTAQPDASEANGAADAATGDSGGAKESGSGGDSGGPDCASVALASGWRGLALAIDRQNAYWVDSGSDTLVSVPVTGGTPAARSSLGPGTFTVAVDTANLYWVSDTQVVKLPLAGGQPIELAAVPVDANGSFTANTAFDVAIDGEYLYYIDNHVGEVRKVPLAGGQPIVLASGEVGGYGVAVDDTNVYWTIRSGSGSIRMIPKGGGAPLTLASGQANPTDLAVDATNLYWVNGGQTGGDGSVVKMPLKGGPALELASAQTRPNAIAIDARSVYWVDSGTIINNSGVLTSIPDGMVMSVPLNGGTPVVLAQGDNQPVALGIDATHVYWLDYGDETSGLSEVMKTLLDRSACRP